MFKEKKLRGLHHGKEVAGERERVEEEEEKEAHSTPAQGGRTGLPPTAMPVRGWPSHLQVLQGHLGQHCTGTLIVRRGAFSISDLRPME